MDIHEYTVAENKNNPEIVETPYKSTYPKAISLERALSKLLCK